MPVSVGRQLQSWGVGGACPSEEGGKEINSLHQSLGGAVSLGELGYILSVQVLHLGVKGWGKERLEA